MLKQMAYMVFLLVMLEAIRNQKFSATTYKGIRRRRTFGQQPPYRHIVRGLRTRLGKQKVMHDSIEHY